LIATEGTPAEDYANALFSHPDAWNVLLLDSDGPVDCSYADLCHRKGIDRLRENQVFWMVQVMETWFLADADALRRFYGADLREGALRGNPEVEAVPKADVFSRLKRATAGGGPGEYHKTKHAPDLLATINASLVRRAAPNCDRLFSLVLAKLSET